MTATTGTTGQSGVPLPEDRDAAVPTARLVGVEMRKMVDTRAGFWLIVVIALLTVAAIVLFAIFAPDDARTFEAFLGIAATPQGFLLPVLGVLLVTSEWGQRAALTTFTLTPRRERVVVAKVVAALLIGLAAILIAVLVGALLTGARGGTDAWVGAGQSTGNFTLLQVLGILQGLAFGMLFLNSAAAIVTFFVVPIVSSLVFNLVSQLQSAAPWVDLGTAQTPFTPGAGDGSGGPTGEEWAQLATASVIWILLPLVIGAWRILRSEVK